MDTVGGKQQLPRPFDLWWQLWNGDGRDDVCGWGLWRNDAEEKLRGDDDIVDRGFGTSPDGKCRGRERMSLGEAHFLFVETSTGNHQCPDDQL